MLRAVIFDFNGVILNDESIHMMLFQKVLNDEGFALTQDDYYQKYLGMDDVDCFQAIYKNNGKKISAVRIKELVSQKSKLYDAYIANHLEFFPKSIDLVRKAASKYLVAVVSGALRHEIDYALKKAKAQKEIGVIVAQEDVKKGKPHPEGYLTALEKMNKTLKRSEKPLLGKECLVIEDSIDGIRSAKEAGMRVVAVAHTYPKERLTLEADWVFQEIREISLPQLAEQF